MDDQEGKTVKIKEWCLDLIEDFREEYLLLSEIQKKNLFPYLCYNSPCQIEIFWISEPIEYQLFVLLHDSERCDKEIVINGPYHGSYFFESLYKLMEHPNWKRKVPNKPDSLFNFNVDLDFFGDVGDQEGRYSDYLLPHLAEFVLLIEYDPFSKIEPGPGSSSIVRDDGWCMIIKGNLLDFVKDQYERFNPIISIKNTVFPEEIHLSKNEPLRVKKKETQYNTMFGAYFFPPVRIGDDVELTFKEKFVNMVGNPIIYPEVEIDFTLGNLWGFFDRYGFLGIKTKDKSKAIQVLNVIFGVSNLFQERTIFPIREQDLISFTKNDENNNLGGFGYRISQIKNQKPFSPVGERKTKFSLSDMRSILKTSEKVLENFELKNLILNWLESISHLKNEEYEQSFIFSWTIIESYISGQYNELLSSNIVKNSDLRKHKENENPQIYLKIEMLKDMNYISIEDYDFLSGCRKKRNSVVHSGEKVSEIEAIEIYSFTTNIIKNHQEINRKINS